MTKFWFRKNHASDSPARLAENQNLVSRHETFDRAREATIHLLTALKQWPGFDSTGTIDGAIDHTLVNIDRLDDALDELRDMVDKFRSIRTITVKTDINSITRSGFYNADTIRNSGHPSTVQIDIENISEEVSRRIKQATSAIAAERTADLSPKPGKQLPTPKDIIFTNRKPAVGDQK